MTYSKSKVECITISVAVVIIVVIFSVWGEEIISPKSISVSDYAGVEYEYGTTGHTISWTITGNRVEGEKTYEIMLDDNIVDSGSWSDGETVSVNVDGLSVGSHSYTIRATAGDWSTSGYTTYVSVIPIIPKIEISTSGDIEYAYGTFGNNISWTIVGRGGISGSYQITRNGSYADDGSWSNGTTINFSVDGLSQGFYNFTLSATSGTVDPQEASIQVTVLPSNARIEIVSSGNLQYKIDSTGHFISWTITAIDLNNGSYQIYLNGSNHDSGDWDNGEKIIINVDGLPLGSYNYTLEATGGIADPQEETIIVNVRTIIESIEISSSGNFQYESGTTEHNISWTIDGINLDNGTYRITRNGSYVESGSWNNETNVIINVDGLAPGSHTYTLKATGGTADPQEKSIVVTVIGEDDGNGDGNGDDNDVAGYPTIFLLTIGIIVMALSYRKYKKKSIF